MHRNHSHVLGAVPRVLFVLALGTVSLGLVLLAGASGPGNGGASPGPRASWLGNAQRHIQEREYRASESRAGLQTPNRRHTLRIYPAPDGIRVVHRPAPGSPEFRSTARGRREDASALPARTRLQSSIPK